MQTWIYYMIARRILVSLCPFSPKGLTFINWLFFLAEFLFIALTFFLSPHWWYGLIAIAIYIFTPLVVPKINIYELQSFSERKMIFSFIGNIVAYILLILMFISIAPENA